MLKRMNCDLQTLKQFLKIPTPEAWLITAKLNLPTLLIDHAHCERKAAATAINLMSKYPEKRELAAVMSPLAREELLHFEKVMALIHDRKIAYGPLPPSNYAQRLHEKATKKNVNARLADLLIIGAIIEARSCERFNAVGPLLEDNTLKKFYASLVQAEARHFQEYLTLAHYYQDNLDDRIFMFIELENKLITSKDTVFRFHSGIPDKSINECETVGGALGVMEGPTDLR